MGFLNSAKEKTQQKKINNVKRFVQII